jgi:hypothetical protein
MRFFLLTILIFNLKTWSFGQASDYETGKGLKLTYTYCGLNTIDIGFGKGKMKPRKEMIGAGGFYGGYINLGYGFRDSESLLTTKASFELTNVFFGTRMNLTHYTDFDSRQIVFLPELGLSYSGIFSIMYGYNVFLTDNKFALNRHSFSISLMPYWKGKSAQK